MGDETTDDSGSSLVNFSSIAIKNMPTRHAGREHVLKHVTFDHVDKKTSNMPVHFGSFCCHLQVRCVMTFYFFFKTKQVIRNWHNKLLK